GGGGRVGGRRAGTRHGARRARAGDDAAPAASPAVARDAPARGRGAGPRTVPPPARAEAPRPTRRAQERRGRRAPSGPCGPSATPVPSPGAPFVVRPPPPAGSFDPSRQLLPGAWRPGRR